MSYGVLRSDDWKPVVKGWAPSITKYDPDQPRDSHGRFGFGGGSSTQSGVTTAKVSDMSPGDSFHIGSHGNITIESIKDDKNPNYARITGVRQSDGKRVTVAVSRNKTYEHTKSKEVKPAATVVQPKQEEAKRLYPPEETKKLREAMSKAIEEHKTEFEKTKGLVFSETDATRQARQNMVDVSRVFGNKVTEFVNAKTSELANEQGLTPITTEDLARLKQNYEDSLGKQANASQETKEYAGGLAAIYSLEIGDRSASIFSDSLLQFGFSQQQIDAFTRATGPGNSEVFTNGISLYGIGPVDRQLGGGLTLTREMSFSAVVNGQGVDGPISVPLRDILASKADAYKELGVFRQESASVESSRFVMPNQYSIQAGILQLYCGERYSSLSSATLINQSILENQSQIQSKFDSLNAQYDSAKPLSDTARKEYIDASKSGDPYNKLYTAVMWETLNNLRAFGGPENSVNVNNIVGSNKKRRAEIQSSIGQASAFFPSDWVRQANEKPINTMKVSSGNGRASYQPWTRTIKLYANDGLSTVLHEMTHHVEMTVPDVAILEKGFWQSRCPQERKTVNVGGGQGDPDTFPDAYSGRYYGGGSWEIASTGMEGMLIHGSYIKGDADYQSFMTGLLLLAGRA